MKHMKKITGIFLTTLLIATSSIGVFAADLGIYIGSDINKYYDLTTFLSKKSTALQEMNAAGLDNVMYVDSKNKITSLKELVSKGSLGNAMRDIKTGDLKSTYKNAKDNSNVNPSEGQNTQDEFKVDDIL